jgi:hypothetical protein
MIIIVLIMIRDKTLVNDRKWLTTVWEFAKCFKPDGMLSSQVLDFGLSLLREKFKGSNKLIIPYWLCVS